MRWGGNHIDQHLFVHIHDGPHVTFASRPPLQSALHAPAPHVSSPPPHEESPLQFTLQAAEVGQRIFAMPHELVPVHCSEHAPVSAQRRSRPPQDDTAVHSTRHFMLGGQSMRRPPHDEMPLQRMRHVSPRQPPLQISGHFMGGAVIPVGQPGAVSIAGFIVSAVVSAVVSSTASVGGSEVSTDALSLAGVEPSMSSANAPSLVEPPQPAMIATSSATTDFMARILAHEW
jgi:hypothetical protein